MRAGIDLVAIGRAIVGHRPAPGDPIRLRAGEELAVEDRDTTYRGWLWGTSRSGTSGWVPAAYVERRGSTAIARWDYDAVELAVEPGETLIVTREESGWLWCTNRRGQSGWVPAEAVMLSPGNGWMETDEG